ncbi:phenylacetate-coenzyme A ligase PaaK-like adenylate-forming protein [Bartonella heixiaziensis]
MSHIIFATGGTTRVPKTLRYKWLNYEFVTHSAAKKLETVFKDCSVNAVANCLTAGGLWRDFYLHMKFVDCSK